jgi:acetyltransferase
MSIRHLDDLFDPASVAVFGASDRLGSVGATVWRNLGAGGYKGALYAVNPSRSAIGDQPVYARAADLPAPPGLAVVCTPPATVAGIVAELGALGTRAAVVLTAGLDAAQKQAVLDAARPHLLRILGHNCIGLLVPGIGLNASFAHTDALPGELAFVSQSGALTTALLDWARARGIGFSHFVSLGEHLDVDFGDLLDYLASDAKTRAILLYVESVQAARKFMSAARSAARNKPVIVVKSGRSQQGQRAAASHTGALAASDAVFDAAVRRAGLLRVDTLQDLFLAAETLARLRRVQGEQLVILTNGGGAGVMAADAAAPLGVELTELSVATLAALDAFLPPNWSHGNPVDIIGDAPVERYVRSLQTLQADPDTGAVLMIHAPTAIVPSADIARALLPMANKDAPPLIGCWLGDGAVVQARSLFHEAGIASVDTPEEAVRAFAMLLDYRHNQAQLLETPPAALPGPPADTDAVRRIVQQVLTQGRDMLTEPEAKAVLAAYHVPVVTTRQAAPNADDAVRMARETGYPVVLKVVSRDISHKSDVGGVALDLADDEAVRAAVLAMLARLRRERPSARVDGFAVQTMVRQKDAHELIVGASVDPVFGPIILFGQGGTAVEVLADRAIGLPPLNVPLARALVARTRVARLLKGFRDTPPADADALHGVLIDVSQLLADIPQIAELDINPLIAGPHGVVGLDARIRLSVTAPAGALNFAIRPYPAHLTEALEWQGRHLTLRAVRPEDEVQHREFLQRLDPEDVRMRVFYSRRSIEHSELARLTQIDYAREMAFVAVEAEPDVERTLAVVRAVADPDNIEAEFGIVVRSDLKGGGLGAMLMNKLIGYLRERGTQWLVATVLTENRRMLELARELGFSEAAAPNDSGTRAIRLAL